MKRDLLQKWQRRQIKQTDDVIKALVKQFSAPKRIANILGLEVPEQFYAEGIVAGMRKESVRIARETDRRLKVRSRGRMTRILDITYQAIRRRPEVFQ